MESGCFHKSEIREQQEKEIKLLSWFGAWRKSFNFQMCMSVMGSVQGREKSEQRKP